MSNYHFIPRPADPSVNVFDNGAFQRLGGRLAASSTVNGPKYSGGSIGAAGGSLDLKTARQFEALFIQLLLKQARQGGSADGPFDSEQTRMAQSIADEQLSLQLADPGLGLAQALLDQIRADGGITYSQPDSAIAPELASSRLPHLKSSIGHARSFDAGSITELIDKLSGKLSDSAVGRATSSILGAIRGAPGHIEEFVSRMTGAVRKASEDSGVPAELMLGQAALESGWGRREITGADGQPSHNLFGIKATPGWKGKVVDILTTEYVGGVPRKMVQTFRAYDSYADSFADYARLISQNARYKEVVQASSPQEAAQKIQKAGYATDPSYADKLISVMAYFAPRDR